MIGLLQFLAFSKLLKGITKDILGLQLDKNSSHHKWLSTHAKPNFFVK